MENAKVNKENQPQPIPLTVRLADNTHFHLEDLTEEAIRNINALLHPQLQQNLHNPFIPTKDDIPRMLTLLNGENFLQMVD